MIDKSEARFVVAVNLILTVDYFEVVYSVVEMKRNFGTETYQTGREILGEAVKAAKVYNSYQKPFRGLACHSAEVGE